MRRYFYIAILILIVTLPLNAQTGERGRTPVVAYGITSPVVTATESQNQLRFTALALAQKIRLQVLSQMGKPVYDSGFQPGNRFEWSVKDQQGSGLRDGVYGCLVTLADLNGEMSHRWAAFRVKEGAVTFDTGNQEAAGGAADEVGNVTILRAEEPSPFTFVSHDGKEGWIESASGGLSFNAGSLSRSRDAVPHLRLTPEGNVGIGVAEPQAKLDVEGLIRTSEGIIFPDGTVQKTAALMNILSLTQTSELTLTGPAGSQSVLNRGASSVGTAVKNRRLAAKVGTVGPLNASEGVTNTFYGQDAGASNNGDLNDNSFFGVASGGQNTDGYFNSAFGYGAGQNNTTGYNNSFFGSSAGVFSTTGSNNVFFGARAGQSNRSEDDNSLIGALSDSAAGITNATAIGCRAKVTQSNSLILGSINGVNGATADTDVGIGTTSPSYRLHIHHTGTYPRIYVQGDTGKYPGFQLGFDSAGSKVALVRAVEQDTNGTALQFYTRNDPSSMVQGMVINDMGNVGIGTATPQEKLHVNGNIRASGSITAFVTSPEELIPDYVFKSGYKLMPVEALARYLEKENHLPNIPPAAEIRKNGLNLAEFQMKLLEKIEELTLYTLQQEKTIKAQQQRLSALEQALERLSRPEHK
jgi:hypothetical protein